MVGESKMKEKHQGWVASFSNGDTVFEEKSEPGQLTAWSKLKQRCVDEGIHITQIQLQLHGSTLIGIPNADGYCAFFEYASSFFKQTPTTYQGIGSVLGDWVVCAFTNESRTVWQDLRPLSDMIGHCHIKPEEHIRKRAMKPVMPDSSKAQARAQAVAESMEREWDEDFDVVMAWFKTYRELMAEWDDDKAIEKLYEDTSIRLTEIEFSIFKETLLGN